MKKDELKDIQKSILKDFDNDFTLCLTTEERAYCYLETRTIYINLNDFIFPTNRSIFDLLHEIGHIKTNTSKMRRFEEEYSATKWAIVQAKKYNITLSLSDRKDFDDYILGLVDSCRKRNGKNIPDNSELLLDWQEVV